MAEPKVFINLSTLKDIANAVKVQLGGDISSRSIRITDLAELIANIVTTTEDVSDTTATPEKVLKGALFYQANGVRTIGSIETYAEEYTVGADIQHGNSCGIAGTIYDIYIGDYEEIR